jgi:hypothetical protein
MTTEEKKPTTELATIKQTPTNMLMNVDSFGQLQRVANMFANSSLVPAHLKGKVADCAIALYMAHRLNEDPLTVMQNIVIISGKASWLTQYMIGRANMSGVFKGRISWRSEGGKDALKVTAYAVLADTGEEVAVAVDMAMAKAEGWTKNPKYASMPEHMLRWRSAAMLVKLYCPEVMMGIPSSIEVEDQTIDVAAVEVKPEPLPKECAVSDAATEAPKARKSRLDKVKEQAQEAQTQVIEQPTIVKEPEMPEMPEFLQRRGEPGETEPEDII